MEANLYTQECVAQQLEHDAETLAQITSKTAEGKKNIEGAIEQLKKADAESGKKNGKLLGALCTALTLFFVVIMLMFGNPFKQDDYSELDQAIAQIPDSNNDSNVDGGVVENQDD